MSQDVAFSGVASGSHKPTRAAAASSNQVEEINPIMAALGIRPPTNGNGHGPARGAARGGARPPRPHPGFNQTSAGAGLLLLLAASMDLVAAAVEADSVVVEVLLVAAAALLVTESG